jgi:sterol desaturase/sphingolipid hydroxylase (fatty acid hydroxylase superfamily)
MLESKIEDENNLKPKGSLAIEPNLHRRKGYGKIVSYLTIISFFMLAPEIGKMLWPKKLPENLRLFNYLIIQINHHVIFIISNLILYFIYVSEIPFLERYRIHNDPWPWKKDKAEWQKLLKETICNLLVNQFIAAPLAGLILFIKEKPTSKMEYAQLPNCFELLWQTFFLMICEDFFFYWCHRILHIKQLYPYIHKMHHKYTNVVGISAENAHPIEFIFGNALPTYSGVLILGGRIHLYTIILWFIVRIMKTTEAHSGYDFSWSPFSRMPFLTCSDFHNFHHLKYKGNYGSFLTIWDRLCGTVNADYKIFKNKIINFENENENKQD